MLQRRTLFKLIETEHKQSADFRRLTCLLLIWSQKTFADNDAHASMTRLPDQCHKSAMTRDLPLNHTNPSGHAAVSWFLRTNFLAHSPSRPQPAVSPDRF